MWKDKNNSKLYMVKENGTKHASRLTKNFKYYKRMLLADRKPSQV